MHFWIKFKKHTEIIKFTFFYIHFYLLNLKIIVKIVSVLRKNFRTHLKQKKTMIDYISLSNCQQIPLNIFLLKTWLLLVLKKLINIEKAIII